MLVLSVFSSLQITRLYMSTGKEQVFSSPTHPPPPRPAPLSEVQHQAFSPPKRPCGKVLALETLAFSSCGKKGAPVLWWPGGCRTACCQGCYSNGFSNQPGSSWEAKWSSLCLPSVYSVTGSSSSPALPPTPRSGLVLINLSTVSAQKSLERPGHLPVQNDVLSFSLEEWAFASLFLPAAGKMSRLDESHGKSDLSKSFSHLLFRTVGTSLVLTPMLNQKEVLMFQQILDN